MHDIDRTPARTWVYLVIILYFAILTIGSAIQFLLAELGMGPLLTGDSARQLESLRLLATWILLPLSRLCMGVWPEISGLMLTWPLVSVGVLAFVAALIFFAAVDFVKKLMKG